MSVIVTEVHIIPIKQNQGLVALARVVLNDAIALDSIGIHLKLSGGYRLTYPTKNDRPLFHPISKEVGMAIEQSILNEMSKRLKVVNNDRYRGAHTA